MPNRKDSQTAKLSRGETEIIEVKKFKGEMIESAPPAKIARGVAKLTQLTLVKTLNEELLSRSQDQA